MINLYKNNFKIEKNEELAHFVNKIILIGENYISFLVSKNRLFLPVHIEPKDAAVDLVADLFVQEKNVLVKFEYFFRNNFSSDQIECEEDFDKFLRCFIYTVIRNNLINLYKENDPVMYNIYRNVNESIRSLDYHVSIHFSDKYVHIVPEIDLRTKPPDKDELMNIVYSGGIAKNVYNTRIFLKLVLDSLENSKEFAQAVRLGDLVSVIKSIMAYELAKSDGAMSESENVMEKLNVKFILDDARFNYSSKLSKYSSKNGLSQNFTQSIYNIIDEIMMDINAGQRRKSIMDLTKTYFKDYDSNLFNKVQYCVELFEDEIAKRFHKERDLIG